jgi:hypothetical protein
MNQFWHINKEVMSQIFVMYKEGLVMIEFWIEAFLNHLVMKM